MEFIRRRMILIADDNQDLATSLSILLRIVGFEVDTVDNGGDAVAHTGSRKPDILLLDIGLPVLNGFQVARHFRSVETLRDVLIIAISGYSRDMNSEMSELAHFDHYLVKPVDMKTLLSLIHVTT